MSDSILDSGQKALTERLKSAAIGTFALVWSAINWQFVYTVYYVLLTFGDRPKDESIGMIGVFWSLGTNYLHFWKPLWMTVFLIVAFELVSLAHFYLKEFFRMKKRIINLKRDHQVGSRKMDIGDVEEILRNTGKKFSGWHGTLKQQVDGLQVYHGQVSNPDDFIIRIHNIENVDRDFNQWVGKFKETHYGGTGDYLRLFSRLIGRHK